MTKSAQPSEFEIGRHLMSLWVPQAIHAAAELGVADALAAGPASAPALAQRLKTHADATARLLDALVVLGLLERHGAEFSLGPLGAFLRSDSPRSRRAWARLMAGEHVWRAWGRLTDCVRSGEPAFSAGAGRRAQTETFDVFAEDADAAAVFHQAMADGTRSVASAIVGAIDFAGVQRVADVGGGYGELLAAALDAHPGSSGHVFDLEHARVGAEALLARRGLTGRAEFVAGDLFSAAPPKADLLLLKSVIHDWNDERSLAILRHCRAAMNAGGRLVIVEPPAPPAGTAVPESVAWIMAFSDLNMLVNTGGRERTASEYAALVGRAELRVTDVRPAGFYSCFVCRRAQE